MAGFDTPLYGNILMVIAAILTLWSMVYYLQMAGAQLRGEKNCNEVLTQKTRHYNAQSLAAML